MEGLNILYKQSAMCTNSTTQYTANSIKVDIDNSQMYNMIDRVPKE